MKIALIVTALKQAGPVKVMEALVQYLSEYPDTRVEVYHLDNFTDSVINLAVPVKYMDKKVFPFEDFDIIHTNGIRPDFFAFINRKKIKYHLSTIHNFVFTDLRYSYNRMVSLIFGFIWIVLWTRADRLVCVSETMKNYYSKWLNPDKLMTIHNGITVNPDQKKNDADIVKVIENFRARGLKVIGSASFLTGIKGIDLVLRMIAREMEYAFVIIGDGKERSSLEKLANKLLVTDRCFFSGFRKNAKDYFHLFDVFVIPSRSEGFGLTLIEAAQQRVPVVCSEIKVFRELMNGEEVTFFKSGDRNSLSEALREAAVTGNKKVEKAYKKYHDNYTGWLMSKRYHDLYLSALIQ